jgi:hypothetical protein
VTCLNNETIIIYALCSNFLVNCGTVVPKYLRTKEFFNIVAVGEDHRGGNVSQESDVIGSTDLGRKRNDDAQLGYSGRIALRREQCDVYC